MLCINVHVILVTSSSQDEKQLDIGDELEMDVYSRISITFNCFAAQKLHLQSAPCCELPVLSAVCSYIDRCLTIMTINTQAAEDGGQRHQHTLALTLYSVQHNTNCQFSA